jgi:hypothetical protein
MNDSETEYDFAGIELPAATERRRDSRCHGQQSAAIGSIGSSSHCLSLRRATIRFCFPSTKCDESEPPAQASMDTKLFVFASHPAACTPDMEGRPGQYSKGAAGALRLCKPKQTGPPRRVRSAPGRRLIYPPTFWGGLNHLRNLLNTKQLCQDL